MLREDHFLVAPSADLINGSPMNSPNGFPQWIPNGFPIQGSSIERLRWMPRDGLPKNAERAPEEESKYGFSNSSSKILTHPAHKQTPLRESRFHLILATQTSAS